MFGKIGIQIHIISFVIIFEFHAFALYGAENCNPAGLDEKCECNECFPGLLGNENKISKIAGGKNCHSYQWTSNKWRPKCEEDGTFSAVQCKGEYLNGRCFCFDSDGSRIFGWSWWNFTTDMTCACSRRVHELKKERKDISLHCTENGSYEELQCDNGLCWCVASLTGKPTQRVYPEPLNIYLPCYNKRNVGSLYLRQCESKSITRAKILEKMKYHGHQYFQLDNALCDPDGSYSRYRIDRNMVRCTWKNGKQIENYQKTVNYIAEMNCNCARDSLIYKEANLEFGLTCEDNGNYEPQQFINGQPFCVDKDGFPTTDLGSIGEIMDCKRSNVQLN